MSAATLLVADLVLGLAAPTLWALAATRHGRTLWCCALAAAAVVVARTAVVAGLWGHGWELAGERAMLGAPVMLVSAAVTLTVLARSRGPTRPVSVRVPIACWCCALAGAGSLLATWVIGYPLSPIGAGAVLSAVAVGCWLTSRVLQDLPRRTTGLLAAWLAAVLTIAVASAGLPPVAVAGSGHRHSAGPTDAGRPPTGAVSVADLRLTAHGAGPVRRFDLVAQTQRVTLPSGRTLDAWTYGELPGPPLVARVGEVVEVTLHNRDLAGGVTIHWHGYHVPNRDDGVAGVTQDAILPGRSFVYRFRADQAGTYWYHTHQRALDGTQRGLYGALVVLPGDIDPAGIDLTLPFHTFGSTGVLGASDQLQHRAATPGTPVRLRLINTDQVPRRFALIGTEFRVAAIDGVDLAGPAPLAGVALRVPAGGRYDLTFTMPGRPVRLVIDGAGDAGLLLGDQRAADPGTRLPDAEFDPLSYGRPAESPWAPMDFDVSATIVLDRLPRVHNRLPSYGYTINGAVFPDVPPISVSAGDLVRIRVVNRGFETHPMHPHGHHVLVLSVNGRAPTTALWLDSFDVRPGEVWEVALRADNPGLWMNHCHNLRHATRGMVMHLEYAGVSTPFSHGRGELNSPE